MSSQRSASLRVTRRAAVLGMLGSVALACAPGARPGGQASTGGGDQPKPGGTLVIRWWTGDPPDLDPYLNVTFRAQEFAGFFYSRLLKFDSGPGVEPNAFTPVPDLAESYEASKDGLTYTFKLRANAKWQNKAPMNGRAVTADDVVWSYQRFMKVSPQKANLSIVKDVTASDPRTVVFTLNAVFAPFETTIASPMFWIMPKEIIEADGDARKRVVGSGPFIFDRDEKGVQIVAKRNPDYYVPGTPYVDEVDLLIVPEDATAVANLRAKKIDINGVSQTDRDALASSNPEILLFDYPQNLLTFLYWRVDAPPFNDVRARQAVSLALDREELIKTLLQGRSKYNNAIPAGLQSWWLDPLSADMGPSAKYFKRDVAAAKALLAAAGHPDGLKVPMIASLNAYGNTFNQGVELAIKQLKDAGIQADLRPQDYSAYISSTFLGKFEPGTIVWGLETPFQEPHDYLFNMYHPKGTRNHAGVNDPQLTDMVEGQMKTLDRAERKKIIFDIQRYLGEQQYYVIAPSGNSSIARQPWVKNFNYESDYGRAAEYVAKVWLDGKPG
jgi:peptide/nickel transport system substrate-binding protein